MVSTFSQSLLVSLTTFGGAFGIAILIFLLIQKEFMDVAAKKPMKRNNTLYIGIVPLLFVFSLLIANRLVQFFK
jgi:hypothetical protein